MSIFPTLKLVFCRFRILPLSVTGAAILVMLPVGLKGQSDSTAKPQTTTIIAGIHYKDAPGGQRLILGNDYRDLWSTPIEVEVLNLQTFAWQLIKRLIAALIRLWLKPSSTHSCACCIVLARDGSKI